MSIIQLTHILKTVLKTISYRSIKLTSRIIKTFDDLNVTLIG